MVEPYLESPSEGRGHSSVVEPLSTAVRLHVQALVLLNGVKKHLKDNNTDAEMF